MKPQQRFFGNKSRNVEQRKTQLLQRLVFAPSIDEFDAAELASRANLPVPTVTAMIEGERLRRMHRG